MIGKTTIRRGPRDERARADIPTVRILFTPDCGGPLPKARVLAPGATSIGRVEGASVILATDGQVSRIHATITNDAGVLRITDSSTNGTYVNGQRTNDARLSDGDIIRVGDSVLLVRLVAEDAVEEPEVYGLLGDAPVMHEIRRTLKLVGPTDATVLIGGQSGTGKEVLARALHAASRAKGPFVAVNCSAIPEQLAESQLFGHVAGAFTGAKSDNPGFFRAANRGVILLDEIGELPLLLQAKLLRALEERTVIPVGAVTPVPFDARVIAATNRSLAIEVAHSRFRGDLLARLTEIEVTMPALKDRLEDVLPLLRHALGPDVPPVSADLAEGLLLYGWPYNVRELFKVAAELKIRGAGAASLDLKLVVSRLDRGHALAAETGVFRAAPPSSPSGSFAAAAPSSGSPATMPAPAFKASRASEPERPIPSREELIVLLREHGGSVAEVGRATGRSRKQVYRWIESHGIDIEAFRSEA